MRSIFALVLLCGLGLAGFAVFQTHSYISQMQTELSVARKNASNVQMVDVFVAGTALRYGQTLTRANVRVAPFPEYAVPTGAYTSEDLLFPNGIDERMVLRAMDPLEPILVTKLTEPGKTAGITSHLSVGKRAFTIPVNQTTGVAGFLRPGDHVDIFWTGRGTNGEMTHLIDSQVRIIAVNQSADMDRTATVVEARTVTVEASPEQAAALAQAQSSGRLSLALVGVDDRESSGMIEMTQDRLLGIVRTERVEVAEPDRCHVRTRRGNEMVLIEIPCTN